jgi:hypothetical protein
MPITLGILAQSRQVVDTGAFQLLESTVLTGSQASVEFTNLTTKYAATYQHLQIRYTGRSSVSANTDDMLLQFNSDTGANYAYHVLETSGAGGAPESYPNTSQTAIGWMRLSGSTATTQSFGAGVIDLLDPFETTKNKTIRCLNGEISSSRRLRLTSGFWNNTNSVTGIKLQATGGNLTQFSRFSLYGIKATA